MKHRATVEAIIVQAQSYALGYRQGMERAQRVLAAGEHEGREELAYYLTCETQLAVPQIIQALAVSPRATAKDS